MDQTRAVESIQSILLVEGSDPIRQSLAEQIEFYVGIDTVEAATGANALKLVKKRKFDLILLDMSLPDFDGRDVYQLMRRSGLETPIVIFIEVDTEADTIASLGLGASQYIIKPFRFGLLLARIRSLVCDQDLNGQAARFTRRFEA
ncbi:MAG: response regulator [Alphaproteobacteria bacterium]